MTTQTTAIHEEMTATAEMLEGFTRLLEQETAAAKKADFKTLDSLQARKKEFARRYQDLAASLSQRKDEVTTLPLSLREGLVRQRTLFTVALDDNLRALDNLKQNSQRLSNRILDAARRALVDDMNGNYAADGKNAAYGKPNLSMAVDRSL